MNRLMTQQQSDTRPELPASSAEIINKAAWPPLEQLQTRFQDSSCQLTRIATDAETRRDRWPTPESSADQSQSSILSEQYRQDAKPHSSVDTTILIRDLLLPATAAELDCGPARPFSRPDPPSAAGASTPGQLPSVDQNHDRRRNEVDLRPAPESSADRSRNLTPQEECRHSARPYSYIDASKEDRDDKIDLFALGRPSGPPSADGARP
ncbi:hypothetical protein NDU88_004286 [Pleurodeles waltl]|uniref:Uncharacterized protein n=1 Tax=Pleurodeles waltl TaxID=8319 RepID=A0AAV7PC07_PLEWA|nr:hypothetical protein NDU88_004286 [Pleurodeles waltl]